MTKSSRICQYTNLTWYSLLLQYGQVCNPNLISDFYNPPTATIFHKASFFYTGYFFFLVALYPSDSIVRFNIETFESLVFILSMFGIVADIVFLTDSRSLPEPNMTESLFPYAVNITLRHTLG
jgi:hypothetical protein